MKLRTRIILSVSVCFAILTGGLVLERRARELNEERRYQTALLNGYHNTWTGIVNTELQRLRATIPVLSHNEDALRALALRNRSGYAESLHEFLLAQRADAPAAVLETATLDGVRFFNSAEDSSGILAESHPVFYRLQPTTVEPPAPQVLSPALIQAVTRAGKPLAGLLKVRESSYALAVAFPLFSRTGITAVSTLFLNITRLLPAFADSVDAPAFILQADGTLVHGTEPTLWRRLDATLFLRSGSGVAIAYDADHRAYAIAWLPLRDLFGEETAILLTIRDITATYWRHQLIVGLSQGGVLVTLALFLGGLHWYLRRSFRPLNTVIGVLNALARGDMRVSLLDAPMLRNDEIGRLASTVEQFRQAQAARNQLALFRQELTVATHIQRSILPSQFPLRPEFSLFAKLQTVREVGGDFYDFFDLPDGRLGLVIADVSDKGFAAALFMTMARTIIRTIAMIVAEPGPCLERANAFLSLDNDAVMFVTTFYGVLDPASGRFCYTNAGHNPPYWLTPDGKATPLARTGGMALGVMADLSFRQLDLTLNPGDGLFFFTDGVTEAINAQGEEFTTTRLETVLSRASTDVHTLIETVIAHVRAFADPTPLADDLTVLALTYHGPAAASEATTQG